MGLDALEPLRLIFWSLLMSLFQKKEETLFVEYLLQGPCASY